MSKYVKLGLVALLGLLLTTSIATAGDQFTVDTWNIDENGSLLPTADSSYVIGASGTEVDNLYIDEITLGGISITSVSSFSTPMEDLGLYVSSVDGSGTIKLYDDGTITTSGDINVNGDGINCDGDLLLTPAGSEVHIDGGLSVGDTTAIGDNNLNVAGTTTLNGAVSVVGTTPKVTVGDGGNEDATILMDGQSTKDFYIATDNADDTLIIGVGSTVGTDERIRIEDSTTATTVTLGDAVTAEDTMLVFDGNELDFHIALDDSDDSLEIGFGSTVETDERITINGSATETIIEIGDAAAEDMSIVIDGNETDYYIALDDSANALIIGEGSTVDTTPAITITTSTQAVEVETDLTVSGGDIAFTSASASKPVLTFTSDVVGATSSSTVYNHTRGGVDAVDGDDIHTDSYTSYDDGTPTADTYVSVLYEVSDSGDASEDGSVAWTVVSAGSDLEYLSLTGTAGFEINAGAADIDVHVDGNDQADLLVVDAGNNDVAILRNLTAGATTDAALLQVTEDHAAADQDVVSIQNDGTLSALFVDQNLATGTTLSPAVEIDSQNVDTAALIVRSPADATGTDADFDDYGVGISAEGVGGGLHVHRDVAAATSALVMIEEDNVDATAPVLIVTTDQDASADDVQVQVISTAAALDTDLMSIVNAGVGRGLFVDQNITTGTTLVPAMEVDSQATNGAALIVRAPTTLTGADGDFNDFVMGISAEGVGGGLHVHRNVATTTGPLVMITEDHADGTMHALHVQSANDATADTSVVHIETTSSAHDQAALQITQDGTIALLVSDGCIVGSVEDLTCSAADPGVATATLTTVTTTVVTDATGNDADQVDLADGTKGQIKVFTLKTDGETSGLEVIPTTLAGGTKITFEDAGDGCVMVFDGTSWVIVANNGGTIS